MDAKSLQAFIEKLDIPKEAKERLLQLSPNQYIGLAKTLVKAFS